MIRKMRFSGAHFKYIFHCRGADREHCWFLYQSLFSVSFCPCEIQYSSFALHNISLLGTLGLPQIESICSGAGK